MKAVAPSRASALPNTSGCNVACSSWALARSVFAVRTSSFVARRASGPFRAMRSAIRSAASITSAGGTTTFTRPSASARSALIGSPVKVSSRATASGMRVLMNTPPPAANSPRLTSGRPKTALSEATTTSQPSSTSNPPATAVAFAAPTTGTASSPRVKRAYPAAPSPALSLGEPSAANDRRSIPAQNARSPVPVRITQRTSGSVSAATRAAPRAPMSSAFSALRASGRFRRSTRTAPCCSLTSTGSAGATPSCCGAVMPRCLVPSGWRSPARHSRAPPGSCRCAARPARPARPGSRCGTVRCTA